MMLKKLTLFLFFIVSFTSYSQLSDRHYLPPLKQQNNNQAIKEQAVYLSTPNTTSFTVNVYRGTSTSILTSFSLSKSTPIKYTLGNGDNNVTLVTNTNTGTILNNSGLRFEAPSGDKFYVNYRGRSNSQAASLTSKGRAALGTNFKWGGIPIEANHNTMSATLGLMATENNTTINIFGYDPNCEFRLQGDPDGITSNTIQIVLNAGESYVLEAIKSQTTANIEGWIGASIQSDKDIVISNGMLNFGINASSASRDAGMDQPVPINKIGKDYIFIRGNGGNQNEFPLIIGTQNNTDIFVNGSTTAIATINDGDFFEIPGSNYSSTAVGGNMLITTSKDTYAYQCTSGSAGTHSVSLNFIAPVNCLLPDTVDNITNIRDIAGITANGGVTVIASTTTPNANITITDDSGTESLTNATPVAGSSDWKTFYVDGLTGDVSVNSTGPIAVGFLGFNGYRGIAGYFSGFDSVPVVDLQTTGGGCFPGLDIEVVNPSYDAYQWYADGVLMPGETNFTLTPPGAGDYYVRVTKGGCTYDSQSISSYYCNPDIIIKKTADTNTVIEGDTINYTITVESLGVDPVTNLVITDALPNGLTIVSTNPSTGSWATPNWTIGTMNSGEIHTIMIQVTVDEFLFNSTVTSLINTITNTQDQTDFNITPDDPTETINISNNDITVTKIALPAADGSYDTLGEVITYQIIVTNEGANTLENIRITDPNADSGTISPSSVVSLAPAASTTFTLEHTINSSDFSAFQVTNTATGLADLSNGFTITDLSDDPNNTTNTDLNSDGEPDDPTITTLHNPRTVITNRRITYRVRKN